MQRDQVFDFATGEWVTPWVTKSPLRLPVAPDGRERRLQHFASSAASLEQVAELRVHDLAKFWPAVMLVKHAQDRELQFGDVDAFEAWQLGGSRHDGRAS
jgi:hypothetical protein